MSLLWQALTICGKIGHQMGHESDFWTGGAFIDCSQVGAGAGVWTDRVAFSRWCDSLTTALPHELPAPTLSVLRSTATTFLWTLAMRARRGTFRFDTIGDISRAADRADFHRTLRLALDELQASAGLPERLDERVERALDIIRAQCCGRPTVHDVAVAVRVSRWHLDRLLQMWTGACFTEHLRRERMNCATSLLLESFLSIKEIAARTGYGNASCFCRDFRASFGISALEWRRTHCRGGSVKTDAIVGRKR